jgi:hypothetical protein
MIFFLASLHRQRYRELVAQTGGDLPIEPVEVVCPTCSTVYVADLAPDEDPVALELEEWAAWERLQAECPDHAHWFAAEP